MGVGNFLPGQRQFRTTAKKHFLALNGIPEEVRIGPNLTKGSFDRLTRTKAPAQGFGHLVKSLCQVTDFIFALNFNGALHLTPGHTPGGLNQLIHREAELTRHSYSKVTDDERQENNRRGESSSDQGHPPINVREVDACANRPAETRRRRAARKTGDLWHTGRKLISMVVLPLEHSLIQRSGSHHIRGVEFSIPMSNSGSLVLIEHKSVTAVISSPLQLFTRSIQYVLLHKAPREVADNHTDGNLFVLNWRRITNEIAFHVIGCCRGAQTTGHERNTPIHLHGGRMAHLVLQSGLDPPAFWIQGLQVLSPTLLRRFGEIEFRHVESAQVRR